jgi:hypothetical protein
MTKTWKFVFVVFFGLVGMAGCSPASGPTIPTPAPSASAQPTMEYKSLPTPVSPNQMIVYNDLEVTMSQAEITTSYATEYGSTREPSAGNKFLWIHITLKNVGPREQDLPAPEHFSALYGETEFKPTYGHRQDHTDYTSLTTVLVQGQEVEAWLRFDIPAALELKDLLFAFLPKSSQVSTGFSSNDHLWGDQPIYLWTCAP